MMLSLTIFYDIPQLNVGMLFMLQADERTVDPEKVRLKSSTTGGPNYTQCNVTDIDKIEDTPSIDEPTFTQPLSTP